MLRNLTWNDEWWRLCFSPSLNRPPMRWVGQPGVPLLNFNFHFRFLHFMRFRLSRLLLMFVCKFIISRDVVTELAGFESPTEYWYGLQFASAPRTERGRPPDFSCKILRTCSFSLNDIAIFQSHRLAEILILGESHALGRYTIRENRTVDISRW